ncbi:PTS fructose transporter subunit IIABC [Candidatus Epulonipiscium viviparus]|uniref:PTS fructose transporter subunit IIABC n=1 Tax=Candidatus Epulonipiscium viviparus TaxID=420336 RepID=UPI0027381127|nr:fructose-specific PTS transporter subunit EIIC [Candidatus Epulopiscium viviparus]
MRVVDLIGESVDLNLTAANKDDAIDKLIDLMYLKGNLTDKAEYKKGILEREAIGTTGVGEGIAVPHSKNKAVTEPGLAVARVVDGVDYDSLDDEPAKLFFMIAAPEGGSDIHLDVLARLFTILMEEGFAEKLLAAESVEEFIGLIDAKEKEKFVVSEPAAASSKYRILAVTACPTGIAHTYMAAESLAAKAAEKGITCKVETNGATGAKNVLTADEISKAECIIVAADKQIDMARFDGKPLIMVKVADGIHKAGELIDRAKDAPIYKHTGDVNVEVAKENVGRKVYKHLMNGVSHMLPFVIGGGLLIALAFLFDDYDINPANFGSNTPFAAMLKQIGGTAFDFMLPVLAGYIAMSIGERPALVVGFVGGALANVGGAGFLGALVAGFLAGYLVKLLVKLCDKLPGSLEGVKPTLIYPLAGTFLMGVMMLFLINPPVALINENMTSFLNNLGTSSKILLGVLVAGMMAIDMGGPINKAAYVFGVASLESGNYDIMAAVMVGGMVPPLAIALATTFFKDKFTTKEREAGLTNYIMGISFITEGAIPFAAADPVRVILGSVTGASIAGAISILLGCALRAPHGGIFVVPVIDNPLGYLIALAVGSAVGAVIIGMLKKNVSDI